MDQYDQIFKALSQSLLAQQTEIAQFKQNIDLCRLKQILKQQNNNIDSQTIDNFYRYVQSRYMVVNIDFQILKKLIKEGEELIYEEQQTNTERLPQEIMFYNYNEIMGNPTNLIQEKLTDSIQKGQDQYNSKKYHKILNSKIKIIEVQEINKIEIIRLRGYGRDGRQKQQQIINDGRFRNKSNVQESKQINAKKVEENQKNDSRNTDFGKIQKQKQEQLKNINNNGNLFQYENLSKQKETDDCNKNKDIEKQINLKDEDIQRLMLVQQKQIQKQGYIEQPIKREKDIQIQKKMEEEKQKQGKELQKEIEEQRFIEQKFEIQQEILVKRKKDEEKQKLILKQEKQVEKQKQIDEQIQKEWQIEIQKNKNEEKQKQKLEQQKQVDKQRQVEQQIQMEWQIQIQKNKNEEKQRQQLEQQKQVEKQRQIESQLQLLKEKEKAKVKEREKKKEIEIQKKKDEEKQRQVLEQQKQVDKQRQIDLQIQREKEIEIQKKKDEDKQRQILQQQKQVEKQRQIELQIQREKEIEIQKKKDEDKQRQILQQQKQVEKQRQIELQIQREKEIEIQKKKDEDKQRQILQQQKQVEKQRQIELQIQREKEIEIQKKKDEEKQRQVLEQQKQVDKQRQIDLQIQREKEIEIQKKKDEDKQRQILQQQKQVEKQRQIELQIQREKEIEIQKKKDEDKQRQILQQQKQVEKQRQIELQIQREKEIEIQKKKDEEKQRQVLEQQKQVDKQRQIDLQIQREKEIEIQKKKDEDKQRQILQQQKQVEKQRQIDLQIQREKEIEIQKKKDEDKQRQILQQQKQVEKQRQIELQLQQQRELKIQQQNAHLMESNIYENFDNVQILTSNIFFDNIVNPDFSILNMTKFMEIYNKLKQNRQQFQDNEFPPQQKSIGPQLDYYEWERLSNLWQDTDIFKKYNTDSRIGLGKWISPSHILQGELGDCYFLTTISSIACRWPDWIRSLFITQKQNNEHIYCVKLCIDGVWQGIILDDYIPIKYNQPAFTKSNDHSIWVMLLEKAYAKAFGSYYNIKSGISTEVMRALTGCNTDDLTTKKDDFEQKLFECIQQKCILTSGSISDQNGLVSSHSYSILKIRTVNHPRLGQITLLKLRNPWGQKEWNGDWSDDSYLWTQELRNQLKLKKKSEGVFYMSLKDFKIHFDHVSVGYFNQSYHYESQQFMINRRKALYFNFEVTQTGNYNILTYQPSKRVHKDKLNYEFSNLRLILAKEQNTYKILEYQQCGAENNIFVGGNLETGKYVLQIKADLKFWDEYNINLCQYGQNKLKFINIGKQEFIKDMFLQYARSKKSGYKQMDNNLQSLEHIGLSLGLGLGFYYYINNSSHKQIQLSSIFQTLKGIKLKKPHRGNYFEITLKPQQDEIVIFKIDPKEFNKSQQYSWTTK